MESSIEKTMKADKAEMMSDAEKMEPSIEKTMKADKAEMNDAGKRANLEAFFEACKIAAEKVAEKKKKTKVVLRRLMQKQIDAVLSTNIRTRPVPICSEELLAGLDDKDLRDSIRSNMAGAAATVYKSREEMRLEKERILKELQTKGLFDAPTKF